MGCFANDDDDDLFKNSNVDTCPAFATTSMEQSSS
jgi:hypothetical protein